MPRVLLGAAVIAAALHAPCPAGGWTPSPEDWRDRLLYQIVTDRFDDGDPSNNEVEGHFDADDGWSLHGGDFAGIARRLDYLAALGVGGIWISPVAVNVDAAYHGYSAQNFTAIAPHFGTEAELRALADACHARGMALILDVICNHTGTLLEGRGAGWPEFRFPGTYTMAYRDARRYAPPFDSLGSYHNNGHIDWGDGADSIEEEWGELFGLDDLRTELPAVRQGLVAAFSWLIDATDCDGFRIDTVKHVPIDFWQEWTPAIRAHAASRGKENFLFFGETWSGDDGQVGRYTGTQAGGASLFNSMLYYPMTYTMLDVFAGSAPPGTIADRYQGLVRYAPEAREQLVTFLDNHDNPRFLSRTSDVSRLELALDFLLTTRGVPIVYYGTEQGFDGSNADAAREDLFDGAYESGPSLGDNFDATHRLYRHLARLGALREDHVALRRGDWTLRYRDGSSVLGFERRQDGEIVLVVLNTASSARTVSVATSFGGGVPLRDLLDSATSHVTDAEGRVSVVVPALEAVLLMETSRWIEPRPQVVAVRPGLGRLARSDAPVEVVFSASMDHPSAEQAFTVDPTRPGSFAWGGDTLRFVPADPWTSDVRQVVRVGAGARSAGVAGRTLRAPFESWFRAAPATPPGYLSGALSGENDHWGPGGEVPSPVRVSGDVTVPTGTTLRIEPGTEVLVAASDDRVGGRDEEHVEIIVEGRLDAAGAPGAPIRFRGDGASVHRRGSWRGIRLAAGSDSLSRLESAQIGNAIVGVRAEAPFAGIRKNVVLFPSSAGFWFAGAAAGEAADNLVVESSADGIVVEEGVLSLVRNTIMDAGHAGIRCVGGSVDIHCGRISFAGDVALAASDGALVTFGPGNHVIAGSGGAYRDVVSTAAGFIDARDNWWDGRVPATDGAVWTVPALDVPGLASVIQSWDGRLLMSARVPSVQRVRIAGTMNAWDPEAATMAPSEDGSWALDLGPVVPGPVQYKLVLDTGAGDVWLPDPGQRERAPDGFGGYNSVYDMSEEVGAQGGRLRATALAGGVEIRFGVDAAAGFAGFHLLREERSASPGCALPRATRAHAGLLRPEGGEVLFLDEDALPETTYRYHLHGVRTDGDLALGIVEVRTPPGARLLLLPPRPNPSSELVRLRVYVPSAGACTVRVHDARGRLVRALHDGMAGAGYLDVPWDGRDEDGRDTASGIYFVRARVAGKDVEAKVVRIR